MLSLIVVILFAMEMAYFATQNTGTVALRFINYEIAGVPMYLVVMASILVGVILSWVISSLSSLSSYFKAKTRENIIHEDSKTIKELKSEIYNLKIENAKFKNKNGTKKEIIVDPDYRAESTNHRFSIS